MSGRRETGIPGALRRSGACAILAVSVTKLQTREIVEKTPNTGKSLEYLTNRARRAALRYAEISPYRLNPKREVWEGIVSGIARQAITFGWPFCP